MGRTIEEILAAAEKKELELSEENKKEVKVEPVEEKTITEDLISKISPVTESVSETIEVLTDDDFVKNVTDETVRQLGLTVRAGAEGAASLFGILYDPVAAIVNTASKIAGGKGDIPTASNQMSQLLDSIGIPNPENATERIVNMVGQGMVAGGGSVSIAKNLANFLSGTSKKVASILAANPGTQVVAGGGAGGSGQATAELGGGPVSQLAASLGGGLITGKMSNIKTDPVPGTIKTTAKEAEKAGVPVLTSDVRPPSTFAGKWLQKTGESIPIIGTGGIRATQQNLRSQAVKEFAESWGVDLGNDSDIIGIVTKDLLRKRGSDLSKYTDLKKSVINSLETKGNVDVSKTVAAIDDEIMRLSKLRSGEMAPIIARLKDWKGAILGQKTVKGADGKEVVVNEGQNLQNIEMLRKQIGQSFEDPSLAAVKQMGQEALNRIYAPLREDMRSFIQTFGSKNDIKRFDVSNARLSEMAGELDNNLLKNILKKGETTPEEINRILFSKKPSDVKLLFKNLDSQGKANARTAIITDMFKKSYNQADETISPDVFKNQIKKMSDQLGIFFNETDLNAVKGLGRILALTKQAGTSNVFPQTGAMLQIPVLGGVLSQSFGGVGQGLVAAVGIGGIARILESPSVRNLLIKLPKLSAGSPEEAALLKRIDDIIILESGDGNEYNADALSSEASGALEGILKVIKPSTANKIQQAVQ